MEIPDRMVEEAELLTLLPASGLNRAVGDEVAGECQHQRDGVLGHCMHGVAADVGETTMPRARQASRSTLLVPVAATAIIFSIGRRAIVSASSISLFHDGDRRVGQPRFDLGLRGSGVLAPGVIAGRTTDVGDDRLAPRNDAFHDPASERAFQCPLRRSVAVQEATGTGRKFGTRGEFGEGEQHRRRTGSEHDDRVAGRPGAHHAFNCRKQRILGVAANDLHGAATAGARRAAQCSDGP